MASTLGFTIIREDSTQIYYYTHGLDEDVISDLIPNLLSVFQMMAKGVVKGSGKSEIKSLTLGEMVFTIRNLDVKTPSKKQNRFYFVLITEQTSNLTEAEEILESLMISFLGFNQGEYLVKMRIDAASQDELEAFDEYLKPIIGKKIGDAKKQCKFPLPSNFVQGMLNSVTEYIQVEDLLSWNEKLVSLGKSYVWISESLTNNESDDIIERIMENLPSGLYKKLEERVKGYL